MRLMRRVQLFGRSTLTFFQIAGQASFMLWDALIVWPLIFAIVAKDLYISCIQ